MHLLKGHHSRNSKRHVLHEMAKVRAVHNRCKLGLYRNFLAEHHSAIRHVQDSIYRLRLAPTETQRPNMFRFTETTLSQE